MDKSKETKYLLGEDRLSDLPDELLSQILSELSTKDSIRTSVLSKRWRSLWLHVPALDLDSNQFHADNYVFKDFIDCFLESNKKLDFKRFKLIHKVYDHHEDSVFGDWIDDAIKHRVRHLTVQNDQVDESESTELVRVSLSLYSCDTLVSLSLCHLALGNHDKSFSLPCLKSMYLDAVQFADDSTLETLISSCESLQKLTIIRYRNDSLETVTVRSKSLERFTLRSKRFERLCLLPAVVVDAPKLEYMTLSDHFSDSFIIHSIGPSPKVYIDVIFNRVKIMRPIETEDPCRFSRRFLVSEFLTAISNVCNMTISAATLEELINEYCFLPLPRFANLYCLHISFLETSLENLPIFLKSCPNLHRLVVEIHECKSVIVETKPVKLSSVPQCFLSSLKFVELNTPDTMTSSKMKLANYFLKHCAVLKELKLSASFGNMISKITNISRRSIRCEIVMD